MGAMMGAWRFWRRVSRGRAGVLLAGALVACRPAGGPAAARLELKPCQLSAPDLPDRVPAQCGTLEVDEDRAPRSPGSPPSTSQGASKTGRKIRLRVAVLEATGARTAQDPLFLLAGGPGQAATEAFLPALPAFAALHQHRDLVLVDQRGTGESNALACPKVEVEKPIETPEAIQAEVRTCLKALSGDPRFYTTPAAMDDLDDVRAALGYDRINLYGGSYGTRAALVYLRQHPEHVRAVVLDGVAAPDWLLGPPMARDAERAIELLWARCAADPDCHARFPRPSEEFKALLGRLADKPVELTVDDPVTAAPTPVKVTRTLLASTVRLLSYVPATQALLPLLVHTAAGGDLRAIAAQSLRARDVVHLSEGMHFAVACSEDFPFYPPDAAESGRGTYVGDAGVLAYMAGCTIWPRGTLPADYHTPVRGDAPVLLLSGELDPVTPPSNAEQVALPLPHARALVARGEGHGTIRGHCVQRIITQFIERASVSDLDAQCLETPRPTPFFLGFTGPRP
ncbi:MAG TPA: alpha/beta fold hydrolase [Polyangia bacterium]|jgi:pimeloyl-ACP methyl ester carboxylesterase|nr:alpha/beta fold hydrolase [Polyangia bacterium]